MKIRQYWSANQQKILPFIYALIGITALLCYLPARKLMIVQDAWIWIIKSNSTLNFFIFLFMWGVVTDHYTKGMPRRKGWLIWGIGFVVIALLFRFVGGMITIFG